MGQEMAVARFEVDIPDEFRAYIDGLVAVGRFGSVGDFLDFAVSNAKWTLEDADRAIDDFEEPDDLKELLLEGLNSGPPIEVNAQFWADLRKQVLTRSTRRSA